MLPAPFYSDLPTELGDDTAWRDQATPATAQPVDGMPGWKAWIARSMHMLSRELRCFAWGYSTWS